MVVRGSFKKNGFIQFIPILLIMVWSAILRLTFLDRIPGLEHDESLVCLGARSVTEGKLSWTGDKVYEGPLTEYCTAAWTYLLGDSHTSIRRLFAVAGLLTVGLAFKAIRSLGFTSALLVTAFFASLPWALMASRVIYASNFTILFNLMFYLLLIRRNSIKTDTFLILAGAAIGLAMNGRLTSIYLIIPILIHLFQIRKPFRIIIPLALISLLILPLSLFNATNGWPAIEVFTGAQNYLASTDTITSPLERIWAFLMTLLESLASERIWLDFPLLSHPVAKTIIIFLLVSGLTAVCVRLKDRKCVELPLFVAILQPFILTPLMTKTTILNGVGLRYHPHYLDMVLGPALILLASGVHVYSGVFQSKIGRIVSGILVMTLLLLHNGWQWHKSVTQPSMATGGYGRWNIRFQEAAKIIRSNYSPADHIITASWIFDEGYPQLKYLLPEFQTVPYLFQLPSMNHHPDPSASKIVLVTQESFLEKITKHPPRIVQIPNRESLKIGSYFSPGVFIDGFTQIDDKLLPIRFNFCVDESNEYNSLSDFEFLKMQGRLLILKDRQDVYETQNQLKNLASKITPRHRDEILLLSRMATSHKLTMLKDGDEWRLQFTRSGDHWMLRLISEKLDASGIFTGEALFY